MSKVYIMPYFLFVDSSEVGFPSLQWPHFKESPLLGVEFFKAINQNQNK